MLPKQLMVWLGNGLQKVWANSLSGARGKRLTNAKFFAKMEVILDYWEKIIQKLKGGRIRNDKNE